MKLSDISLPSLHPTDEVTDLYALLNNTGTDYPRDKSIVDLFADMVKKHGDKTAVKMENTSLTYRELDLRSNRVANWLISRGVKTETVVAIYLDRSVNVIVSMLGILKAGGAYLPLNTDYPFDRIKFILGDSKARVLISEIAYLREANHLQWYSPYLDSILCVDSNDFYQEIEVRNELMRKELWEYLGSNAQDDIAGGGWMNSYDGANFTREEMDEYAQNAFEKLKPYLNKNTRVLEIGCASGITMYKVAPLVKEFYGTDLSQPIIDYNKKVCEERGITNIKLQCIEAEDISLVGERDFDVVIINSVVQAFSGFNYLRRIINYSIDLLGDKGILFMGDIMDLDRKDALLLDVQTYKRAHPYAKTNLNFSNEMFVPRSFFEDMRAEFPSIRKAISTDKIHTISNELTKYRYDSILEVSKSEAPAAITKHKQQFDARMLEGYSTEACNVSVSSNQLSNIIFTSGSTGKPKGVMVEHHSIIRAVRNTNYLEITPSDVVLQACEISFDPACIEIFGSLLNGATLCLVSKKKLFSTSALATYMVRNDVTILQIVASLFHLHAEANANLFTGLRLLMLGGEVLNTTLVNKVREACPSLQILNCYGPTENTINTTTFEIDGSYDAIPIGTPISNTGVYILNKKLQLQPVGISGELYVYGEGLARGYLNDEALTAERFVDDPLRPGEKMYCTGDLVRLRHDHQIEFLGRADEQVKIKGHRVELHEIEKVMLQIPQVSQAVIVFAKNILCGYVTMIEDMDVDVMKQLLAIDLPFYMIPQHIIKLEQFPLGVHGKIDRKALPDPESFINSLEDTYVAPTNAVEGKLAEIFQQVLGLDKVGIRDDFFALGGHSLLATKVLTLVHKELNAKVRLEDIFENPRIDRLALVLGKSEQATYQEIEAVPQQDHYELSYAQRRMWMTDKVDALKLAYNMTDAYIFEGKVHEHAFERALQAIINRHESLRTIFITEDSQPYQKILPTLAVPLSRIDLREQPDREARAQQLISEEAAIAFDLSTGPLLRFLLIRLEENKYVFFQKLHHIISDGWSMELLVNEVCTFYNGYRTGVEERLQPLRIQYKDFAAWQNGLLSGGNLTQLKTYWNERFAEKPSPLSLPLDFARPAVKQSDAEKLFFKLDAITSQKVEDIGSKRGTTTYMTVLGLIGMLVAKVTRQHDFVIGSPVSGRNEASLHNQIGLYLNTLPMRVTINSAQTFSDHLDEIKKDTLAAFDHQEYPIDLLMDDLKLTRDVSRSSLFDIGFTWQNVEEGASYGFEGFKVFGYTTGQQKVKTDLWFHAWDSDGEINLSVTYDKALFRKETVLSFIDDFKLIAEAMLNNANRAAGSVIDTIAADQAEKKRSDKKKQSLESFLKTKKTAVSITPHSLVSTSVLNPLMGFPMITVPAISGVLLNEWVKNNKEAITTQLRSTGAVLFRGFGISSVEAFEQLSQLLGESQMKYMDQSSPRSLVGEKVYTSTDYPSDQEINMHNELSYSQDWPLRILFFCLRQPASGGETPISDSRKVLANISEATRAKFAEKGILYVRNLVDGLGLSWRSVYQTDDKKAVEEYCRKNGVNFEWLSGQHLRISWKKDAIVTHPFTGEQVWFNHGFFFNARNLPEEVRLGIEDPAHYPSDTFYGDGTPIEEEVIAELRQAFDAAKVLFPWQKGDVLLLDNMLMAHGRSSFTGERKVLVSMNTPFSAIANQ